MKRIILLFAYIIGSMVPLMAQITGSVGAGTYFDQNSVRPVLVGQLGVLNESEGSNSFAGFEIAVIYGDGIVFVENLGMYQVGGAPKRILPKPRNPTMGFLFGSGFAAGKADIWILNEQKKSVLVEDQKIIGWAGKVALPIMFHTKKGRVSLVAQPGASVVWDPSFPPIFVAHMEFKIQMR